LGQANAKKLLSKVFAYLFKQRFSGKLSNSLENWENEKNTEQMKKC